MVKSEIKKDKYERRIEKKKKSDLLVNRLMFEFVLGVIGIFGMLSVKKNIETNYAFYTYAVPVLLVLGLAAAIFFAVLLVKRRKAKIDESEKVVTSLNLLGVSVVFLLTMAVYKLTFDATFVVFAYLAALVLYYVFQIFRTDFFLCSLFAAAGVLLMRAVTKYYGSRVVLLIRIALAAVGVVGLVLAFLLLGGKGTLSFGGKKRRLIEKKDHVWPLIVASALALCGAVVSFLVPAFTVYAMIALLAAYLVTAIVYVVNMM